MRNKKTAKILKQAGETQTEGIILAFIFSEFFYMRSMVLSNLNDKQLNEDIPLDSFREYE